MIGFFFYIYTMRINYDKIKKVITILISISVGVVCVYYWYDHLNIRG